MIKTTQNNYSDYVNSNYTTTISTSTLGDTLTFNDQTVTVSLPDDMDDISILGNEFTYTTTPMPNTITLGDVVITEKKLERLSALLDIIEGMGESDLLDMLNTQTALNKVKNDTTESD